MVHYPNTSAIQSGTNIFLFFIFAYNYYSQAHKLFHILNFLYLPVTLHLGLWAPPQNPAISLFSCSAILSAVDIICLLHPLLYPHYSIVWHLHSLSLDAFYTLCATFYLLNCLWQPTQDWKLWLIMEPATETNIHNWQILVNLQ